MHHIAWATTDADMPNWQATLDRAGLPNSGLIDRHYFHSLYTREPGGILYELATIEPGFTVDGPWRRSAGASSSRRASRPTASASRPA